MSKLVRDWDDYIQIKMEPEVRHVIAHLAFAIEALAMGCPNGALDNVKAVEGLYMFSGDDPKEWESYYRAVARKKEVMRVACKKKKKGKKCKGR